MMGFAYVRNNIFKDHEDFGCWLNKWIFSESNAVQTTHIVPKKY